MAAYEENDGGRLPLTWAQTKRMPLTQLVSPARDVHTAGAAVHASLPSPQRSGAARAPVWNLALVNSSC